MALTVVGAIASIGMLFGTLGYYLGIKEGIRQEKEEAQMESLVEKSKVKVEESEE